MDDEVDRLAKRRELRKIGVPWIETLTAVGNALGECVELLSRSAKRGDLRLRLLQKRADQGGAEISGRAADQDLHEARSRSSPRGTNTSSTYRQETTFSG